MSDWEFVMSTHRPHLTPKGGAVGNPLTDNSRLHSTGAALMVGTITNINSDRGMVSVRTEDANYSVFELVSDADIVIGDSVQWADDTGLGSEMITNLRTAERFEVHFENHWVPEANLRRQLHRE